MLGEIVIDIPIEDQAAEKAQEISLFYDDKGWVDRRDYTWVLYARSRMSYPQLEGFRNRIIHAAQEWKREHGLDPNLFALITELARAGVIWKPVTAAPGLKAETLWLWTKMGFADIRRDAFEAARVAFKAEAEAVRNRVALLDGIIELPKRLAMGTAGVAVESLQKLLPEYVSERNRTVEFVYANYPQMTVEHKAAADMAITKIQADDKTVRSALEKIGMSLEDFGKPIPAMALGAVTAVTAAVTMTIVIAALIAFLTVAILWHQRIRNKLILEQARAVKDVKEQALKAIELEQRQKVGALSPELTEDERRKAVAEIDSWAAKRRAEVAKDYAEQIGVVSKFVAAPEKPLIPRWVKWPIAVGAGLLTGYGLWKAVIRVPVVPAVPKPPRKPRPAPPTPFMKALPYIGAVGGTAALLTFIFWLARATALPPPPAPRLPAPPRAS